MPLNITSLLWFLAILAMIPVTLWLLKRTPMGGAGGRPGAPRTVAVLPLSAQQKIVTVEVGQGEERLWLVLGVSAQGVRTLHTMSAQGDSPEAAATVPAPPAATFAQLLTRLKGQPPGGNDRAP
jgi:flagellar protein FliO/FliZ